MRRERHSHAGRRLAVALGVSALAIVLLAPMVSAAPPKTKLASKSSAGVQGNGNSGASDISASGRFVVYESQADNLVSGDGNGGADIFIRDFKKGKTKLISKAIGGGPGDKGSSEPSISASARFVAFRSSAQDLIPGGTDNSDFIFVRDRTKNKTELISRNNQGEHADGDSDASDISPDGRWVAFSARANNLVGRDDNGKTQIYLFDRKKDKIIIVSRNKAGTAGNGASNYPAVSEDGRYVVYESRATNLTSKNTKGNKQIFKFDRATKKTTMISRNKAGKAGNGDSEYPSISDSGSRVLYRSDATNLISNDTNGLPDAYMRNRDTKKTQRVSLNWKGKQLNGTAGPSMPDISGNGRWVAFEYSATNAIKGVTDLEWHVYARNLKTGKVKLVSKRNNRGNGISFFPALSRVGAFVSFNSRATNLSSNDTNDKDDVFRRGPIN